MYECKFQIRCYFIVGCHCRSDRKLVVSIGSANGYYNVVFLGSVS